MHTDEWSLWEDGKDGILAPVVFCIIAGSYPGKRTPITWWHADNSVPCALQDGRFWKLTGALVRGEILHLGC